LRKSRIVGRTQLYALNNLNKRVSLFLKDFKECLRIAAQEKRERNLADSHIGAATAAARSV
jgi:hypothetical protein